MDPWQRLSLDATFAIDADDHWAASEVGWLVSRQQGKGEKLQVYDLGHLFLWPKPADSDPKVILHTGHEFANVEAHFRKLKRRIMSTPWMRRQLLGGGRETARGISGISTGMGKRVFELENGNLLILQTRTASAGIGQTVDILVIDEAQESSAAAMEALLFTQDGVPNAQVLYAGTVPTELQDGAHFEALRDRGRAGTFPRTTWIEFSPDGSDDPDKVDAIASDDPKVWAQSSPALGLRTSIEAIQDRYNAMKDTNLAGFRAQRLSIWPSRKQGGTSRVIKLNDWRACPPAGASQAPVVLSLEVSKNRRQSWLLAVSSSAAGTPQVELVPVARDSAQLTFLGTAGVVERVAEVVADNPDVVGIAVDSFGEAAALVPSIAEAVTQIEGWKASRRKFEVWQINGPQWVRAGGTVRDLIAHHQLGHGSLDDDQRVYSPALENAIGDADVFDRDGVQVFKRHLSGPHSGPFFAFLPGISAWQDLASRPKKPKAEIF